MRQEKNSDCSVFFSSLFASSLSGSSKKKGYNKNMVRLNFFRSDNFSMPVHFCTCLLQQTKIEQMWHTTILYCIHCVAFTKHYQNHIKKNKACTITLAFLLPIYQRFEEPGHQKKTHTKCVKSP